MLRTSLLLLFCLLLIPIFGENDQRLDRAIEKINYDDDIFSYKTKSVILEDDEKSVREVDYNPLSDPKYTLVSVNGREPSSKEIKKFYKELEDEDSDDSSLDGFLGNEYKKIYDDGKIAKFTYITKESFMPKKDFLLDGEITINLEKEEVVSIKLTNPGEFSIMGAKLKKMEMEFYFDNFNDNYMVLSSMNFNMNGKFLMKEFSQSSESTLYNYAMVN